MLVLAVCAVYGWDRTGVVVSLPLLEIVLSPRCENDQVLQKLRQNRYHPYRDPNQEEMAYKDRIIVEPWTGMCHLFFSTNPMPHNTGAESGCWRVLFTDSSLPPNNKVNNNLIP